MPTVRQINDKIRECERRIDDLISVKNHSINREEDTPNIDKMIQNRMDLIHKLEKEKEDKFWELKTRGKSYCPFCEGELKPVMFMGREPDGFYCSNCKKGFNDELQQVSYTL